MKTTKSVFHKFNFLFLAVLVSVPFLAGNNGCPSNAIEVKRKRGLKFDVKVNEIKENGIFMVVDPREASEITPNFKLSDKGCLASAGQVGTVAHFDCGLVGYKKESYGFSSLPFLTDEFSFSLKTISGVDFPCKKQEYPEASDQQDFTYYYVDMNLKKAAESSEWLGIGVDQDGVERMKKFGTVVKCETVKGLPILGVPTGLTATLTSGTATVMWTDNSAKNESTNNASEDGFIIERSTDNSTFVEAGKVAADVTSFTESNLTGTTYYYRVAAYDQYGNSDYSNTFTITGGGSTPPTPTPTGPTPTAPTNLAATPLSDSQIDIDWDDNSSDETGFKVERSTDGTNFTEIASSVAADSISYSSTGLTHSTTYYYRVRAYNTNGNSAYTNIANTTTQSGAPDAPLSFAAQTVGPQINLQWQDVAMDETGYEIEKGTTSGVYTITITEPAGFGMMTYFDTAVSSGNTYYYRIRAVKSGFPASAWSSEVSDSIP